MTFEEAISSAINSFYKEKYAIVHVYYLEDNFPKDYTWPDVKCDRARVSGSSITYIDEGNEMILRFISLTKDNIRGTILNGRCNIGFIDKDIDKEIIKEIIIPCCNLGNAKHYFF